MGTIGGLFWDPYGWYGVVFMVSVLLVTSLLLMGLLSLAVPTQQDDGDLA